MTDHQLLFLELYLYCIIGVWYALTDQRFFQKDSNAFRSTPVTSTGEFDCGVPHLVQSFPDVCHPHCRIVLFTDNTNLIARFSDLAFVQKGLVSAEWLNSNKLSLNPRTKCQICIRIGDRASNSNKFSNVKLSSVN